MKLILKLAKTFMRLPISVYLRESPVIAHFPEHFIEPHSENCEIQKRNKSILPWNVATVWVCSVRLSA